MSLLQRLFKTGDEELVSRPEFEEHLEHEKDERRRVAARLRMLEIQLANEGRLPRMPHGERGR